MLRTNLACGAVRTRIVFVFALVFVMAVAASPGPRSALARQAGAPSAPPGSQPEEIAVPADSARAAAALKDSPRHGEWVDIALPARGADKPAGTLKTWVVYPERSGKAPVVLVIHEIFGLTDWVRAVADQLAAEGFIAVAPDLLSGMGPGGGGTESLGEGVREVIRTLTAEDQAHRLNAARDYALALPAAGASSASIGFCWGGSASFNYAVSQPRLNAAVVYYGTAPMKDSAPDAEAFARIACPVLGLYGGEDARVTATVEPTASAMKAAGKAFDAHVYDGAGHGFLRQQSGQDGANLKAASEAWKATVAFLRKNTQEQQEIGR